ncbi:hypothetical protein [Ketobacter sp.]|uniref:hypothetical protein n=1 Tax=Ketobacter sp. TaxID=2083498 RepID=UPI000F1A5E6E|nr:hypothetical protein [Ketobacter sp.]RLU00257.1 MAG: hypothetical protein D9N14_07135 [Ketobacter sp.]
MLSANQGFRITAAVGLLVLALGILVSFYYPPLPGAADAGFSLSIIALEFTTSLASSTALFNGNSTLIYTYQTGHLLDMFYLAAYGAFLGLANLSAWYCQRRALSLIGIIAAGIAASADFAENLQLMQLTQGLLGNGSAPDFWLLRLFVTTKFLMITVSLLCLLPLMWHRGRLGKAFCLSTLLLVPSTLLTLLGYFAFSSAMCGLIMVAWLCLLIWMVRQRNSATSTATPNKPLTKQPAL